MNLKFVYILISVSLVDCGLLRKPKVYNAVITTDDNLQPSRSYPFIQPVIHETPITYHHYLGGYDYSPYHIPQIIQTRPNEAQPHQTVPQLPPTPSNEPEQPIDEPEKNTNSEEPPKKDEPKDTKQTIENTERPPITLNEFGLPPSLIPLQSFSSQYPYNLQPYPHTSYPLIYDSFGYHPNPPLLPPFSYYPSSPPQQEIQYISHNQQPSQETKFLINNNDNQQNIDNIEKNEQEIPVEVQPQQTDVRNYVSKNKDIPDVMPPPLPISTKKLESS